MFKKILVCLDGSQLAEQILPYVEAHASRFGSKVILLQVVGLSSPAFASGATLPIHTGLMAEQVQRGTGSQGLLGACGAIVKSERPGC